LLELEVQSSFPELEVQSSLLELEVVQEVLKVQEVLLWSPSALQEVLEVRGVLWRVREPSAILL